ncbi:MAG: hypothetical protein ACTS2F_24765 [Thainema sp.]
MITSHANEATTATNQVQPETTTATFIEVAETPADVALSGQTLSLMQMKTVQITA